MMTAPTLAQQNAVLLADRTLEAYRMVAFNDDRSISNCGSAVYQAAQKLVLETLRLAFPDLAAQDVYQVWVDCNESAAYCARIVRDRIADEAELDQLADDPEYVAWLEKEDARGDLAGSPEELECRNDFCSGPEGGQLRTVVARAGASRGPDPYQMYKLACGHVVADMGV